jgi:hypothetical protein
VTPWLILAAVVVPWVALFAICLSVILTVSRFTDDRHEALMADSRPCPRCETEGAWVDDDGFAVCGWCCASYEVVTL